MATHGGRTGPGITDDLAASRDVDSAVTSILDAASGGDRGPRRRGPARPPRLTSVRRRRGRRLASHTFALVDLAVVVALTTAIVVVAVSEPLLRATVAQVAPLTLAATLAVRMLRRSSAYRFARREGLGHHLARVASVIVASGGASWIVAVALDAGTTVERAPFVWTLSALGALVTLHAGWWSTVRRWRTEGWLTPNVVLVGATGRAERLIEDALDHQDVHILGVFDDRLARSPSAIHGVPVLGDTTALLEHRITPHLDLIVVTVDPAAMSRVREIMTRLAVLPNDVTLMIDEPGDDVRARVAAIAQLTDSPLAPLRGTVDAERRAFAKRVQDLALGIPMLVVLSPILALAAIAVRLDSRGPVLFNQRRHGFNGEVITVHKFRTMRHGAADARAERQVTAGDDRITRVGKFLRSTSIDELPQLFNVVRGEMSLVGPRPHAIGMKTGEIESAQLVAEYAHRHRIKPGITGWAAVNGSRGPLHEPDDVRRRVALDIEYIERQSMWLDLKIIALTLPSFFGDRSTVR